MAEPKGERQGTRTDRDAAAGQMQSQSTQGQPQVQSENQQRQQTGLSRRQEGSLRPFGFMRRFTEDMDRLAVR